jgi:uncharacterized protein (TIGR02145 family)
MKNNLKFLTAFALLSMGAANAQTGIGNTAPKATLDVTGTPATATTADGIIAPRLTGDQLAAKTAYGADQTAAQVYVTAAATTPAGATINVTAPGYYHFDGAVWISAAASAAASEPWYNVATGTAATANTQNVYQLGNVGIGTTAPTQKLEVVGQIKASDGDVNHGYAILGYGDGTQAGSIAFHKQNNVRLGYIGFDNTHLLYNSENNANHLFRGGRVSIGQGTDGNIPDAWLEVNDGGGQLNTILGFTVVDNETPGSLSGLTNKLGTSITNNWSGSGGESALINRANSGFEFVSQTGTGTFSNLMTIKGNGNVGIGTTTPDASAALDVTSTTKGFLPPRMTNAQMQAIVNPVDGLMIYNTTLGCMAYYNNGSFNCTHNAPTLPAPVAPGGSTFAGHFNGITAEVSVDNTLSTYTTGETFDQNTFCASKYISAQGCAGLTHVTGASGTVYPLVNINGQCWFSTNLQEKPTNFANYTATSWLNSSPGDQGHWGYYNTVTSSGAAGWGTNVPAAGEGYLYQWSAAMNNSITERSQGACPSGFHVPSDCEWMYLEHGQGMSISQQNLLGVWRSETANNQGTPGYKLRNAGLGSTNTSGFSVVLSGFRNIDGSFLFRQADGSTYTWSSTASGSNATFRGFENNRPGVVRSSNTKVFALSVRCLKD